MVGLKRKIRASRALYVTHLEDMQNVVRLHKASSTAALEEISALASSNSISIKEVRNDGFVPPLYVFQFWLYCSDQCSCGIEHLPFPLREQFLDAEGVEANSLFDELQNTLSTHQGEMAHFAGELRQVSIFTLPVEFN